MDRKSWMAGLFMGFALMCAGVAQAQAPPPPAEAGPPPHEHMRGRMPGSGFEMLGFGRGGGPKSIKGAPFSATAVTESTQVLSDGTNIHRSTQAWLFRDSEGRVRREMSFTGVGPLTNSGPARSFIVIRDPVAGTGFVLDGQKKTANKFTARAYSGRGSKPEGGRFAEREQKMIASGALKKESLGTQVINGLSAEGTRITHMIPAGQMGNDKPISIVTETWFSKDLQENIMIKRNNPWSGTTTYKLTNIQRTEPAATMFQVPSDFTIQAGPEPGAGRHGRGGQAPQPPTGLEDEEE
jgi:hypothetical protein